MIFSSKLLTKNERLGYASCRGQNHKRVKLPNQDAVLAQKNKYGTFLAVADGVGSQNFSQIGSKAAVKAAYDAFMKFETGTIPVNAITKMAFQLFKESIPLEKTGQASTTCIFAYISNKYGLFIGHVGDGACFLEINDTFTLLKADNRDFSNVVHPLNATKDHANWVTRHFKLNSSDRINIMLATDGITEDIVPGKEKDCLHYFVDSLRKRPWWLSSFTVRRQITDWGVPGSNDDKTIIVYSKG